MKTKSIPLLSPMIDASDLASIQKQMFSASPAFKPATAPVTVIDTPDGYVTVLDGDGAPFIHCLRTTWDAMVQKYSSQPECGPQREAQFLNPIARP